MKKLNGKFISRVLALAIAVCGAFSLVSCKKDDKGSEVEETSKVVNIGDNGVVNDNELIGHGDLEEMPSKPSSQETDEEDEFEESASSIQGFWRTYDGYEFDFFDGEARLYDPIEQIELKGTYKSDDKTFVDITIEDATISYTLDLGEQEDFMGNPAGLFLTLNNKTTGVNYVCTPYSRNRVENLDEALQNGEITVDAPIIEVDDGSIGIFQEDGGPMEEEPEDMESEESEDIVEEE